MDTFGVTALLSWNQDNLFLQRVLIILMPMDICHDTGLNLWAHNVYFYFIILMLFRAPGLTSLQAILVYWQDLPQTVIYFFSWTNLFNEKTTDDFENSLLTKCGKVLSWCRYLLGIFVKKYSSALKSKKNFLFSLPRHWS